MEKTGKEKIRRIYNIVFAVCTVAVGLLLVSQVWGIFRSSPQKPYSRASVGERLIAISPVLVLWIVGLIGNTVLSAITPKAPISLKGETGSADALKKWQRRFVHSGKEVEGVRKLRLARLLTTIFGGVAILTLLLLGVRYLFDGNYVVRQSAAVFHHHNGAAARLISALPFLVAAILTGFIVSLVCDHMRNREIELLKDAFADAMRQKKLGSADAAPRILREKGEEGKTLLLSEKWEKFTAEKAKFFSIARLSLRIGLFVAAVVLIVFGVRWGGMDLVFEKARSICQQCIGIG